MIIGFCRVCLKEENNKVKKITVYGFLLLYQARAQNEWLIMAWCHIGNTLDTSLQHYILRLTWWSGVSGKSPCACVHLVFVAEQPGSYDHIIVNDDLESAYKQLKDILAEVSP